MFSHPIDEPIAVAVYLLDMERGTWRMAGDVLLQPDPELPRIAQEAGKTLAQHAATEVGLTFGRVFTAPDTVLYCSAHATGGSGFDHIHLVIKLGTLAHHVVFQSQLSANLEKVSQ